MTKREHDALTKENKRYHQAGYWTFPHRRSERNLRYKQSRGYAVEARDPLAARPSGDVARRVGHLAVFRGAGADIRPHLRRILGL